MSEMCKCGHPRSAHGEHKGIRPGDMVCSRDNCEACGQDEYGCPCLEFEPVGVEHERFVLHTPYPDGSWRGLEKCLGCQSTPEGLLVFELREEAERFLKDNGLVDDGVVIVPVTITTPRVRGKVEPR